MYIPEDEPPEFRSRLVQAHYTLLSPDPHGQVLGGYLVLSAPVFEVTLRYSYEDLEPTQIPPRYVLYFADTAFDLNEDVPLDDSTSAGHFPDRPKRSQTSRLKGRGGRPFQRSCVAAFE